MFDVMEDEGIHANFENELVAKAHVWGIVAAGGSARVEPEGDGTYNVFLQEKQKFLEYKFETEEQAEAFRNGFGFWTNQESRMLTNIDETRPAVVVVTDCEQAPTAEEENMRVLRALRILRNSFKGYWDDDAHQGTEWFGDKSIFTIERAIFWMELLLRPDEDVTVLENGDIQVDLRHDDEAFEDRLEYFFNVLPDENGIVVVPRPSDLFEW